MAERRIVNGWIYEKGGDGSIRPIGPAQQQAPADPTFGYKGPQAQASLGQTQASTASTQVNAQKTRQEIDQSAALFNAQKLEAEAKARLAELQAQQAQAEVDSKDPLNPQVLSSAAADAMSKLQTIDRIKKNVGSAWLPAIGFGAPTASGIGGTNAANVRTDIGTLKSGGALSEVLKMTQATGKNPFTPMSNSDVELIATNTGNLAQDQSPSNFNANLGNYQNAYTKAYAGAVGLKALNDEIRRLEPTIPASRRMAFRKDALRRYNERMAAQATPAQPQSRPSGVIDFNDWGK